MVREQPIPLRSLTQGPYAYPSPQEEQAEEEDAVKQFERQQTFVQELEARYLGLCTTKESTKEERDRARRNCVSSQERLDELRTRYRIAFAKCHAFMTENEIEAAGSAAKHEQEKEIMFRPNAQDFVEAMEADVKEIATVIKCDWLSLLPNALSDLERTWHAAEKTGQPVGLTWSQVRAAIVQKYHYALC